MGERDEIGITEPSSGQPLALPAKGSAASSPPRILCVDDEPAVLKLLQRALEAQFEIVTANDPLQALGLLEGGMKFSVIIADMKMPQMDGAEFLARVRRMAPDSTRLAMTGCLERELPPEEVFGILAEPCPLNLLQASVHAAVERHALHAALRGTETVLAPLPFRVADEGLPLRTPDLIPALDAATASLGLESWLHPTGSLTNEPSTARLAVRAAVAEKFFRLGHAIEAERILRPALWDFLQRCEADRPRADGELELACRLALRLAEVSRSPAWVDYVFRLFTGVSRPLSSDAIEALHELLRRIPGVNHLAFSRYLSALRACRHEFGPGEQFLFRRIESLEALFTP